MAIKSRVRAYERRRVGPEVLVTGKAQSSAVYGLTNGKPGMPSVTHLFRNPTLTVHPGDFVKVRYTPSGATCLIQKMKLLDTDEFPDDAFDLTPPLESAILAPMPNVSTYFGGYAYVRSTQITYMPGSTTQVRVKMFDLLLRTTAGE